MYSCVLIRSESKWRKKHFKFRGYKSLQTSIIRGFTVQCISFDAELPMYPLHKIVYKFFKIISIKSSRLNLRDLSNDLSQIIYWGTIGWQVLIYCNIDCQYTIVMFSVKNAICVKLRKSQCPMDHEMETFFPNLDLCKGNPPVTGAFRSQRANDVELWCFLWY